jgi:CubicO group peptidase (beta-lactamase class C family)
LVARENQVLFDKGFGYADLEWQIPDSPDTKFRLGSITKQFTAAAILLLEQEGKLSTDDPVKKYLPDAPAAWDKVTIYNLLTHTSGIPNFTSFADYRSTEAQPATPEQLVSRFRDKPLDFAPGEQWSYSNSGYVLLGYLLERITGEYYQTFLEEKFFKPLGMSNSGYDSNLLVIPHHAVGYTESGIAQHAGYIDMTIPFSAGGLYSTTHDLLRWNQALYDGRVLSAAELKKMTTPFKEDYACGLGVRTIRGSTVYEHSGGIEGFTTDMAYYPDEKLTIIALSNLNWSTADVIVANLGEVAHGRKIVLTSERKEIAVAPETLAEYVGTYELKPNLRIAITLQGQHLAAQATNQSTFRLFAESSTLFFFKDVDAQIEFFKNDRGQVDHMILHQRGQDQKGTKRTTGTGD